MGGERVDPNVIQFDVAREESEQAYVCCQPLNGQQCVVLAALDKNIMQNNHVRKNDVDRTDLDAGMGFVRECREGFLSNEMLRHGELQSQHDEEKQRHEACDNPTDCFDGAANVRVDLRLYQRGARYKSLREVFSSTRHAANCNRVQQVPDMYCSLVIWDVLSLQGRRLFLFPCIRHNENHMTT